MQLKKIKLAIVLAILQSTSYSQNWDIDLAKDINPQYPVSEYWKITSASAYYISAGVPICMFVQGMVTKDTKLKRKSKEIFVVVAIELIISESMKLGFNRQRPAEKYPGEIFPYRDVSGQSFPSGHTSLSFAVAASLSIQCKKWYVTVPAYVWATTVGYSRIYLGVHYPSDVIGGALVGIGSAYLMHWANKKLFSVKKIRHQ